ncbi:winged-helix domain-containing protein [Halomicrobium salinisoli]|uniref:winged-helix domain-containing protein n=1 Tax=Halomicrobium salinisoli TaxID=2878391 RepID=UPI001CF0A97D|nr:winged-helix domain-containing protein [Halomicrobium salinisoli]
MLDAFPFAAYNLAVGLLTGLGIAAVLVGPTVVDYHRVLLLTVAGLVLFLVGGPLAALAAPSLVHWVHGLAALVVVLGLYDPLENDLRRDAWADVLLREPVQVRQRAAWMTPMDDDVLRLFHSKGLVLTPAIIAYNIDYSREEVNRRLAELEDRGFVERVERGKYRITDLGTQYVEGSVTSGPLDRPWTVRTEDREAKR